MRNLCATVFLLVTLAGLAAAQKITTDYDHNTDFSKYKTFKWVRPPETGDPFMNPRIMDAVNAQLTAKDLQLVTDGPADIGVMANVATRQQRSFERYYSGGGWRWRPGYATTVVNNYEVGTLVVDLFDTNNKQAVWRGTAAGTLADTPEKNTKKINKAVAKMFKKFPPK